MHPIPLIYSSDDEHYGDSVNGDFVWKQENRATKLHNFSAINGATGDCMFIYIS